MYGKTVQINIKKVLAGSYFVFAFALALASCHLLFSFSFSLFLFALIVFDFIVFVYLFNAVFFVYKNILIPLFISDSCNTICVLICAFNFFSILFSFSVLCSCRAHIQIDSSFWNATAKNVRQKGFILFAAIVLTVSVKFVDKYKYIFRNVAQHCCYESNW